MMVVALVVVDGPTTRGFNKRGAGVVSVCMLFVCAWLGNKTRVYPAGARREVGRVWSRGGCRLAGLWYRWRIERNNFQTDHRRSVEDLCNGPLRCLICLGVRERGEMR